MTKRTWLLTSGLAALAVAGSVVALRAPAPKPEPAPAAIALVSFTETLMTEAGSGGDPPGRHVSIYASHRSERIDTLRFLSRVDGRVTEERLWKAGSPEVITVRDWSACAETIQQMPGPRPETLDMVVEEIFGPARIPADAKRSGKGTSAWKVTDGMVTTEYTDGGGSYPDRVVKLKGPSGQVGTVIDKGSVGTSKGLPDWQPDWQDCKPSQPPPGR
ncbi:hypothetical protein [Streptomyces sp. NPDC058657]|uniref:hypothetical protein n=1 Tax=unclassified Streptomyces TaxID=2593676 RepID=UPI003658C949